MANKAIFLDRDDTLIEDPGYISHPNQIKLLDGVDKSLTELHSMGYKLVVVSNQSGVARGIVSEDALGEIHNRLKQLLAEKGTPLDGIYYCPYHPDGVIEKYRKESDWRKPNPGMLLAAAGEMNIDLGRSWMIGNSSRDIEAGLKAGCKTILINHPSHSASHKPGEPTPDYRAVNIKEAVNIVKKHHRSSGESPAQNNPAAGLESSSLPDPSTVVADEERGTKDARPEQSRGEKRESVSADRTEQLLGDILEQLKAIRRNNMFGEFSITRLIAGVLQIIVLFCLLLSVWFLMSPNRPDNALLITLAFAMVLQMMALTFYIMHGRK
jgi:D-glycero-D-manno-heptose 1,7-bisphosphate phosphatase